MGMALGLSHSALAVPYVVDFTATETDVVGASDYLLFADIFGYTDSSSSSRTIFYDLASETFFIDKAPLLANEVFTSAAGSNMFQLVYTFDDPDEFVRNFSLSNREQGPQGFANAVFSGAVQNTNANSLGVSFDYAVAPSALPGSVTFDLTDPGSGGIFLSAAAPAGAPELDPCGTVSVTTMLFVGLLVLAGRRAPANFTLAKSR